jgi:dTDP-4-amino-4,6-dideoxygalactose transaminase
MYVEKQRIIISKILEILMPKKSIYVPHIDVNRSNCIMLPIMVENREKLLLFFKDHYFFTSPQYSEAIEWMSAFGYLRGSCPKSEIIIEQNVIIPTHYKMSEKEINDLCKILQNIL